MKKKNIYSIISALLCISILSGCAELDNLFVTDDGSQEQEDEISSLGLTPEFDYVIPESLPEIVVKFRRQTQAADFVLQLLTPIICDK